MTGPFPSAWQAGLDGSRADRRAERLANSATGGREMSERTNSEVQVSYDLARENNDLTVATITRVFENGYKVLAIIEGEDAEAFIDAWNARAAL